MPTLGELLITGGVCTRQQVEDALRNQVILGGLLGTNLMELGYLDEQTLAKYLSKQHNLPCMYGDDIHPDPLALVLLPPDMVERLNMIPFLLEGKRLQMLCVSPNDLRALDEAFFATGLRPDPIVVPELRFWQLLRKLYGVDRHLRYVALNTSDFLSGMLSDRAAPANRAAPAGAELIDQAAFDKLYQRRDGFPDSQPPATEPPEATEPADASAPAPALPMLDESDLELFEEPPGPAEAGPPGGIERRVWLALDGPTGRRAEDARLAERAAAPPSMPPAPEEPDETLDLATATERLAQAPHRQAIAAGVLGLARRSFKRAMLFTLHRDMAIGWEARGLGPEATAFRSLVVPLSAPSVFQLVVESRSHYMGALARTPLNVQFLRATGKQVPLSACVLPISVRGRVVNLFYGDNGHKAHCPHDIGELLILAQRMGPAYEELFHRCRPVVLGG
jgi:hypothetical protein